MKEFNKLISENYYKKYLLYIQIEVCKNKSHLLKNIINIGLISNYEEYKNYVYELIDEERTWKETVNKIYKQFDFTQKAEKEEHFKLEKKFIVMKFVQNEFDKSKTNSKQNTEQLTLGL